MRTPSTICTESARAPRDDCARAVRRKPRAGRKFQKFGAGGSYVFRIFWRPLQLLPLKRRPAIAERRRKQRGEKFRCPPKMDRLSTSATWVECTAGHPPASLTVAGRGGDRAGGCLAWKPTCVPRAAPARLECPLSRVARCRALAPERLASPDPSSFLGGVSSMSSHFSRAMTRHVMPCRPMPCDLICASFRWRGGCLCRSRSAAGVVRLLVMQRVCRRTNRVLSSCAHACAFQRRFR